jgi:hypothetical protein
MMRMKGTRALAGRGGRVALDLDQVQRQEEHQGAQRRIQQQGQQVGAAEIAHPEQGQGQQGRRVAQLDQHEGGEGQRREDQRRQHGGVASQPRVDDAIRP